MKGDNAPGSEHEQHDHGAGKFQDCDIPAKWPFARLAANAARAKPDMVIHVGDYLYRESACPIGDEGCSGSPYGDNWATWKADFFDPARPLLEAAPWVMIRGNHEICTRAGKGYFRFLASFTTNSGLSTECVDHIPHYVVKIAGKSLIVMDTSNADDSCGESCHSALYSQDFTDMRPRRGSWWLSHRPVWGIGQKFTVNSTLQQALKSSNGRLPDGIHFALSGHMHIWELLTFADGRSPQLIVGNGGTLLDKINRPLRGREIGGTTVSYAKLEHNFGYTLLRPVKTGSGWTATVFNEAGKAKFVCTLRLNTASCR